MNSASDTKSALKRTGQACNPLAAGLAYQAPVSTGADGRYRNDFLTFISRS
jgi:hypothetical protein